MTVLAWVAVAFIGGLGSVLRFIVDRVVASRVRTSFPLGTLLVNITGSLALGVLSGMAVGGNLSLVAGTAAVGSYTTFSTWMLETQRLTEERQNLVAAINIALSVALGVVAAGLGQLLGERL